MGSHETVAWVGVELILFFHAYCYHFKWAQIVSTTRCGSFKTCYVQNHRTEIIEGEVWPHTIPCSIRKYVKGTNVLWRVGTNVQYNSKNTHL